MNFPPPTEKQARAIWAAATGLAVAMIVALLVVVVWGLGKTLHLLAPVLWPIAVAGILAYLLDPLVDSLEKRRGLRRSRAIVCVFGAAVAIVVGIGASVVPQIVRETRDLFERVPEYAEQLRARAESWVDHPPPVLRRFFDRTVPRTGTNPPPLATTNNVASPSVPSASAAPIDWGRLLGGESAKSATEWLAKALARVGGWLFGQFSLVASFFGVMVGLALVPVYTFYLLLEKEGIQRRWTDYLPVKNSEFKDELVFVLRAINDYLIVFFRGQVLVAICDGALYTIGFLVIGVPYAVLIGVVATALTMIPFVGAITTCVAALIAALVQYGDWQHPVLVLVVFGIVQGLEGLVISPRIMGNRVGLHPLTIIVAVMAGTTLLGGLLGGILAIPLTAALRVILGRYVWKKGGASKIVVA